MHPHPPQLAKVTVGGFRAIGEEVELDLAPLTVLVGPNGAGKSSVLQAIALTAQSAYAPANQFDLATSGPIVDLNGGRGEGGELRLEHLYHGGAGAIAVELALGEGAYPGASLRYRWARTMDGIWTQRFVVEGSKPLEVRSDRGSAGPMVAQRVLSRRLIDGLGSLEVDRVNGVPSFAAKELVPECTALFELLGRVALLTDLRGLGLSHRDATGAAARYVGPHGEEVLRLISSVEVQSSPEYEAFRDWMRRFGMPRVSAGWAGRNELRVSYAGGGGSLDVSNAAGGSRQGLLLAAQLLLTPSGSLLLIEEPENNLHPRWEKELAELFADAVARGQQLIVTTHSEVLVAALANAVRREDVPLDEDSVALWHLDRSEGGVAAERIPISARGNLASWVKSFAAVDDELFREWTDALPE